MPTINYNAALPAFSSISGRSSIDINKWVSELKFNISSLIKSLFSNNEQGFAYDPNDSTTLYQDAAGTIPVTAAGQPVGLTLDKSAGLVRGINIFTNPATKPTATYIDGIATFTNAAFAISVTQLGSAKLGVWYEVRYTITSITGKIRPYVGNSGGGTERSSVGVYKEFILCAGSNNNSSITSMQTGTNATISNISFKEVAGNHAYQTKSSMRPLLAASPQRLDYDTVDDKLTTTLPAQLTGCTVVRSVPNVGTQILIDQTIPTPYNDNTDHCGLVVINRALTASETSQITKLFNKAAGV